MFTHNFKYTFKILFKNKILIFWTFAFPLILATLFYMAFSNIEKSEKLSLIDIAVVKNDFFENDILWKKTFQELSDESNHNQLFHTQYVSLEEAQQLLASEKIVGYLYLKEEPVIVVNHNGINETILKQVTEEINQTKQMIKDIIQIKNNNVVNPYEEILTPILNTQITLKNRSRSNLSYTMIEFYTLIAMTCLYGGILGMTTMNQNLANMSSKGKRVSVSPTSKRKLILSSALASYLTQLIGIFLLFLYTIFILKVDYGPHLLFTMLLTLVGCLAGLSLGIAIATLIKSNENTKTGIIISITMLGCFLSGMMGITMKYIIDKNIPLLNIINPANMITDGFYSLYYYDTFDRFFLNLGSLFLFTSVMIVLSTIQLRRQKYDSI